MENPQLVTVEDSDYIPGVCNIGPAEIQRRKQYFLFGAVGALLLASLFWLTELSGFLLVISVIVLFAAGFGVGIGYFQWADRFCVAFGVLGVFNFREEVGKVDNIEDRKAKSKDRAKVLQMSGKSIIVGVVYTTVVVILEFLIGFPTLIGN